MKNFNSFKENTICIICAKSISEGLPNKNVKKIQNIPLISYAFNKAKKNKFKYICVSSDSEKVFKLAKKHSIKVFFKRSKKLCNKNVAKILAWKDAITKSEKFFKKKFKYMIDIEVTNPLINENDLDIFLKSFFNKRQNYDGQFCITEAKKNPYFNMIEYKNKKYVLSKKKKQNKITARQNAPKVFEHVAGLYVFKRDYILKSKHILDGTIYGYKVSMLKSFDIDSILDFKLVKLLLKNKKII